MVKNKMKKIVLPGEVIGSAEEFLPGYGTKEENGNIFATVIGKVKTDQGSMTVSIEPVNPIIELKINDKVYGVVTDISKDFIIVQIVSNEELKSVSGGPQSGTIHVSKISKNYVNRSEDEFKVWDIVRAKVIKGKPSVQLSTADDQLGVIKADCAKCGKPLRRENNMLVCDKCKRSERRKLANDFGEVKITYG